MPSGQFQIMRLSAKTADIPLPSYQTTGAAGLDICAAVEGETRIAPREIALIPTGFAIAVPHGYEVQVRPRSGLALHYGITLINSPGTIDSDYRGEVKIPLINHGKESFTLRRGERIAQMVIARIMQVELREVTAFTDPTERGCRGFGHTGR